MCPSSRGDQPLTKGLCSQHYWQQIRLRSVQRLEEKDVLKEPGLPDLIQRADEVVSLYVRLSAADSEGYCSCYTCGERARWQDTDAGHFIPRANMFLRFDTVRNIRVQCHYCNRHLRGNLGVFAQKLNEEKDGLADLLLEESTIVYKPSREELKAIIREYTDKVNKLKRRVKV